MRAIEGVGILGVGRLGKVLGRLLAPRFRLTVSDIDIRKAKQLSKQIGAEFVAAEALPSTCELLLLCIPGSAVRPFLGECATQGEPHPLYLNMATNVPTHELVAADGLQGLPLAGLKLIGQFTALARGLPAVFVTGSADEDCLATLRTVFGPLGRVVVGDETVVGELNRVATEAALRFCLDLAERLGALSQDPEWRRAGLKCVAAGTLLDYPPDENNAYTNRIMAAISRENQKTGCC